MLTHRNLRLTAPVVLGLLLATSSPALAQPSIHWRKDYDTVRKEAVDKGLPIVIDFITDNCLWCKKMFYRYLHQKLPRCLCMPEYNPLLL